MENPRDLEILVVDDDKIVCQLHKNVLKRYGVKDPVICFDGACALEHLDREQHKGKNFLVFLDINMPVMNAWKFLGICGKRLYADRVFVVIVTSSTYEADLSLAKKWDQVIDYCRKPFKIEDIRAVKDLVERFLEKRGREYKR